MPDARDNKMIFAQTEDDYNHLRLQAQQYVLLLQDPMAVYNYIMFTIKPPVSPHTRGETMSETIDVGHPS